MRNIEKYKDNIESNINVCGLYQEIYKIIYEKYSHDCCDNCDKCYDDCIRWLAKEYKEPLLDDVEKEYLSGVIKPFRNRVKYIVKTYGVSEARQFIRIIMCDGEYSSLPFFKGGTMYKGMKVDKQYTLQELGL